MIAFLRRYPLASALAILAMVLAAVLALEYASGASLAERISAASAQRAAPVQTRLLPAIAAVNPDQEYAETGARPLFTPTRRPAPPAAQAAGAGAMTKGQYTLTGVTIAGGTKIALLREKSSGRVVRVEQGKEVNGITVAQIDPEQVTLTQGGDQEVVPMLVAKAAPQPPIPVPVPPGAAGPFAPVAENAPPVAPGANPVARPAQPPVAQPAPPAQVPGRDPPGQGVNALFGPRPGSALDPTTQAPLTPEELLARRRARRNEQSQ